MTEYDYPGGHKKMSKEIAEPGYSKPTISMTEYDYPEGHKKMSEEIAEPMYSNPAMSKNEYEEVPASVSFVQPAAVYGTTTGNGIAYVNPGYHTKIKRELSGESRFCSLAFVLTMISIILSVIALVVAIVALTRYRSNDGESTECALCTEALPDDICTGIHNYYVSICPAGGDPRDHPLPTGTNGSLSTGTDGSLLTGTDRGQSTNNDCVDQCAAQASCRNISGTFMCRCGADLEGDGRASGTGCTAKIWDFEVDLSTGVTQGNHIPWHSTLTNGNNCNRQAVFKLDLRNAPKKVLEVQVDVSVDRNAWMLNLGDSQSNDGYSGDYGDQYYAAEFWFVPYRLQLEGNVNAKGIPNNLGTGLGVWTTLTTDLVSPNETSTILITVGHFWVSVDNFKDLYWTLRDDNRLFVLDGREDPYGPGRANYDLYLAVNRVINGAYRSGNGLCNVKVRIL